MIISALLTVVHVIVCFILIITVLLQSGKGADLAGAFGGAGSQTAFGSRGPATFLSRLTSGAAITFMVTSLALSLFFYKGTGSSSSVVPADDAKPASSAPVQPGPITPGAPTPGKSSAPTGNVPGPSGAGAPAKSEQKPPENLPKP